MSCPKLSLALIFLGPHVSMNSLFTNICNLCEIWGSHGGEDSSRSRLGYNTVWCCGRMPTFRRIMLPPSSGWG